MTEESEGYLVKEGIASNEEAAFEALKEILAIKRAEDPLGTHEKTADFSAALIQELSDSVVRGTRLFHLLASSTLEEGVSLPFDVPGGRIKKFIREEL
ncbi:MAG: hypothetical protein AAB460_01635 [Patescibacteria group bacterium]